MKKYKISIGINIVLLLTLMISCSNNSNSNNSSNSRNITNGHWNRLEYLCSRGFEFYEKLDTFSLKGINIIIDTSNIKYPFYAIRFDSTSVEVQYFKSPDQTFYTSYKKIKNYYISTKVYNDLKCQDFSYRDVTIIYPDKIILYDYFIENDFEQLTTISFLYKNGNKKFYNDTTEMGVYYNICDTVNENNISILFPTMEKSKF